MAGVELYPHLVVWAIGEARRRRTATDVARDSTNGGLSGGVAGGGVVGPSEFENQPVASR